MSATRPVSQLVRERLEGELPDTIQVLAAGRLPSDPAHLRPPALYVVPESAAGAANTLVNGVSQRVTETVAVVIAVGAVNAPLAADARADIETWRGEVRAALLGWEPEGATPVLYRNGELVVTGRNGLLVWAESYTTETLWRAT